LTVIVRFQPFLTNEVKPNINKLTFILVETYLTLYKTVLY
jgi:hypothetical protein